MCFSLSEETGDRLGRFVYRLYHHAYAIFQGPGIFVTDAGEFSFIGVVCFILAPVLVFCYMVFMPLQQKIHFYKKNYWLIVTEDEIGLRNDTEELRYTYTDMHNIENRKTYFDFHTPDKNHFIIPKRLLNENELKMIKHQV